MSLTHATLTPEQFAERGNGIFEREIRAHLRPEDQDQFIAIDIDSGEFAIDRDDFTATERLLARRPSAQIWLARVGHKAAYRIGRGAVTGGSA